MTTPLLKTLGFEAPQLGPISKFAQEPISSLVGLIPLDFGSQSLYLINGGSAELELSKYIQQNSSHGLTSVVYAGKPALGDDKIYLRPAQLSTFCPPLDLVPPSFLESLFQYVGNALGASALSGFVPNDKVKQMKFDDTTQWTTFYSKILEFLSKYGINKELSTKLFEKLGLAVINNVTGFEYAMDGEVFTGGVSLPIALTEETVFDEIMQVYEDTPPNEVQGTPGNLIYHVTKACHFIFVRKAANGTQICFSFFLKAAPPYHGYSLRYEKLLPKTENAFATLDPSEIIKAAGPIVSPFGVEGVPTDSPGGTQGAQETATISPAGSTITDEERQGLLNELKKIEGLNAVFAHANKVLGEEIKRLIRQRKEPSTDEELKHAKAQLELKIKKLLLKLTQYDASLRDITQQFESLNDNLKALAEEKKTAQERITKLEEELIQSRST